MSVNGFSGFSGCGPGDGELSRKKLNLMTAPPLIPPPLRLSPHSLTDSTVMHMSTCSLSVLAKYDLLHS